MNIYINFAEIKEKIAEIYQHVTRPAFESMLAFSIVLFGIMGTVIIVHDYSTKTAQAELQVAKLMSLTKERDLQHAIQIEKLHIAENITSLKYQLKIAETQAAANPYVLDTTHNVSPVNVFIDAANSKYTIETSDGASEIEISMIKVNNRTYTPEQRKLMTMAFHIGQDVGFPETVQSLLLQETRAGAYGDRIGDINLPIGKRSYGVMQMKVATAKKVLNRYRTLIPKYFPKRKTYKRLRDEEIIIRLIQDDEFNIRLAALNFGIHRNASKSWAGAVVAYNTGQRTANKIKYPKKHTYYGHVLKRMVSEVRPFNKETNLTL